jgi:uncharacterized protein YuzE
MAKIRRITLDQEVGASYIYLEKIGHGEAKKQICLGDLVLDFSDEGSLLGIELLDSVTSKDLKSKKLRKNLKDLGIPVVDL